MRRFIRHFKLMHLTKDHLIHLAWICFCRAGIQFLCRIQPLLESFPIRHTCILPEVGHLLADLLIKLVIFCFFHIGLQSFAQYFFQFRPRFDQIRPGRAFSNIE